MASLRCKKIYDYVNETFDKCLCRRLRQCHTFTNGRTKTWQSPDENFSMVTRSKGIDAAGIKNKYDFMHSMGLEIRIKGKQNDDDLGLTRTRGYQNIIDARCELCGRTFKCKADVKLHSKTHHSKMALTARICNERRTLTDCKVVIIGDSCGICGKDFKCKTDVELHKRKRHFTEWRKKKKRRKKKTRLVLRIGEEVISTVSVKRKHLKRGYQNGYVDKGWANVRRNVEAEGEVKESEVVEGDDNVYQLQELKSSCNGDDDSDDQMTLASDNLDKGNKDATNGEREVLGIVKKESEKLDGLENEFSVDDALELQRKYAPGAQGESRVLDANFSVESKTEEVCVKTEERSEIEEHYEKIKNIVNCILNVNNVTMDQVLKKCKDGSRRNHGEYKFPFICQNSIIKEEVFVNEDDHKNHSNLTSEPGVERSKTFVGGEQVPKEEADDVTPKQNLEFTSQKIDSLVLSSNKEEIQDVRFDDKNVKIDPNSYYLRETKVLIRNNVQGTIKIDDDCLEITQLQKKENFQKTDQLIIDNDSFHLKNGNYIFNVEDDDRLDGRRNDEDNEFFQQKKRTSSINCVRENTLVNDEEISNYLHEEKCYVFNVNQKDAFNNNNNNNNNDDDDDNDDDVAIDKVNRQYNNEKQAKKRKKEYKCKKTEVNRNNSKTLEDYISTCNSSVWIKEEVILDDCVFCTNDSNL